MDSNYMIKLREDFVLLAEDAKNYMASKQAEKVKAVPTAIKPKSE